MRTFWLALGVFVALGLMGTGAYLWVQHREEEAQNKRDRSPPAFCEVGGVACFTNEGECQRRKGSCERVEAYSCMSATTVTDRKRMTWCLRTFGDCENLRQPLLREAEAKDVTECLIFRTPRAGVP